MDDKIDRQSNIPEEDSVADALSRQVEYYRRELNKSIGQCNRAGELLKKHEWNYDNICPECEFSQEDGHHADCALDKFLTEQEIVIELIRNRIAELEAERKRLREALETVKETPHAYMYVTKGIEPPCPQCMAMKEIAAEAVGKE